MPGVFFTSDHHFGHKLIIDFESRPFANVQDMDQAMIESWNAVVGAGDTVFHLGDFSFLGLEATRDIISRLQGYKILILGNHDRGRGRSWWLEAGFDEVSEYPLIYKDFFFLSHEPMYMNKHMPYVNVHGHIHGQKYEGKHHYNICVEHTGYKPLSFEAIRDAVTVSEEG
ncbi:phosphoesterase [Paenibacillus sp. FSL R7-0273]|uniref:metallophosphoesterase n=1 Tax=Paenibacillus sp. FSL R7-0273 TaxID=1536772 RepID=UPI0004F5B921|nr:metallophosphoesterase [Paenibacillus sp. FSL R7-0273]AIQ47879.1 phosphoesterase [Paenibacillus sp. FSL R7-0273]OMF94568.1 phosphoesterase [Paenibacillus sp. FSL R7-0273]